MTEWIVKWKANGWRNAVGGPVANQDLIKAAVYWREKLQEIGYVSYIWIPRPENEMADRYCNQAMDKQEEEQKERARSEAERWRRCWDSSSDSDY